MHNTGGHQDVADGANLTIIVLPTFRGKNPTIVDQVVSITTPGEVIGAIVTQEGIAINPKRTDLIEKVDQFLSNNPNFKLNLKTIQELKAHGEKMAGRKYELPEIS